MWDYMYPTRHGRVTPMVKWISRHGSRDYLHTKPWNPVIVWYIARLWWSSTHDSYTDGAERRYSPPDWDILSAAGVNTLGPDISPHGLLPARSVCEASDLNRQASGCQQPRLSRSFSLEL